MNLSGEILQTYRWYFFLNHVKPHTVPSQSNFPRNNDFLYGNKSELHFQSAQFCTQKKKLSTNKQSLFPLLLINGVSWLNTPQAFFSVKFWKIQYCKPGLGICIPLWYKSDWLIWRHRFIHVVMSNLWFFNYTIVLTSLARIKDQKLGNCSLQCFLTYWCATSVEGSALLRISKIDVVLWLEWKHLIISSLCLRTDSAFW